ncbi:MAG: hypothetical protein WCA35_23735 [Kovacikia sp.]
MDAVGTIKAKLSFLVDLSAEERKALPKMGDKSRAFVSKALEVATQNPDFLPRSFNLEELRKDVQLFEALYPLLLSMTQLQELLDDTCWRWAVRRMRRHCRCITTRRRVDRGRD